MKPLSLLLHPSSLGAHLDSVFMPAVPPGTKEEAK
jgi:hypothetical protein